jgi:hypothetical protein
MAEEIGRFATVAHDSRRVTSPSRRRAARTGLWRSCVARDGLPDTFGKPKSEAGAAFDQEIVDFVARARVPLMFGAYDTTAGRVQRGLFLAPDAGGPRPFAIYRKTRLFPLTERVPALLDSPRLRQALPWLGRGPRGGRAVVIPSRRPAARRSTSHHSFATTCSTRHRARRCARGADVIITLSNDSVVRVWPGRRCTAGRGVPQHRDPAAADSRHQYRHLGGDRRDRAGRRRGLDDARDGRRIDRSERRIRR